MKGFRSAGVFVSAVLGFSLTGQAPAHTVNLGTVNPERTHMIYDYEQSTQLYEQDTRDAFPGTVAVEPHEFSGIGGTTVRSGAAVADSARGISDASGSAGTTPSAHQSVRAEADVAKAEKWLMIVTGLGLVAFQLGRVQRLLHHRPLAG